MRIDFRIYARRSIEDNCGFSLTAEGLENRALIFGNEYKMIHTLRQLPHFPGHQPRAIRPMTHMHHHATIGTAAQPIQEWLERYIIQMHNVKTVRNFIGQFCGSTTIPPHFGQLPASV